MKHSSLLIASILSFYSLQSCEQQPNKLKLLFNDFCTGALSSSIAMTVYAPFHYFQNRNIQNLPIAYNPLWWFKGAPALAVGKAPTIAVQMTSYGALTRAMQNETGQLSSAQQTFAATTAGAISAFITNSTHLIALHQENKGLGLLPTLNQLPNGAYSLTRGLGSTITREMLFTNIYLILLKDLKTHIQRRVPNKKLSDGISCLLSGAIIAGATQPFMVITALLYSDIEKKQYKNGFDAAKIIFKENGFQGFYKGSGYRSVGVTLALPVFDYIQGLLKLLALKN